LKAYKKAYYARNAERLKALNKAYYARNTERLKALNKAYYARNTERAKAQNKTYWAKRRELYGSVHCNAQRNAYAAAWRLRNPERVKAYWVKRRERYGCLECKDWPDPRQGWPHYDGYCWRCFSDKFRDDERVKSRGRVELRVRIYLDSHFKEFVHDQPIHTAHCVCSHRRRIDHRRLIGNTLVCVETDENFHKYYDPDDEEARYHDVIMAFGGKLCFMRFNPHKFNLDDRYNHGPPLAERLERLHAEITRHVGRLERGENSAYLEVWHLYYPEGTRDYYEEAGAPAGL
jgi:hypothetical protein